MPYVLKPNKLYVKNPENSEFLPQNIITDQTTQEVIEQVEASGAATIANVQQAVTDSQNAINGIDAQRDTIIASIASVAGQGTDTTLTQSGVAADAQVTGDTIGNLKSELQAFVDGVTEVPVSVGQVLDNYVSYSTGKIKSDSETFGHVDYIPISNYIKIKYSKIKRTDSVDATGLAFYSAPTGASGYISGVKALRNQAANGYELTEVDVPEGANYVAFSAWKDTTTYGEPELYGVVDNQVLEDIAEIKSDIEDVQGDIVGITEQLKGDTVPITLNFTRDSVAYDFDGNQVPANTPVMWRGGMVVAPTVSNLISAAGSATMTVAETLTLEAGTYTVSLRDGSATVAYDSESVEVYQYAPYTFTLASDTSVTITPGTVCKMIQCEKRSFPTPWHIGGATRAATVLNVSLPTGYTIDDKIGIGVMFVPYTDMLKNYNGESELVYIDTSGGNIIRLHIDGDTMKLEFGMTINSTSYSFNIPTVFKLSPKPGDMMGLYLEIYKGKKITGWLYRDGSVLCTSRYGDIPAFGTVNRFQVGIKKTGGNTNYVANATFGNLEVTEAPNALDYFRRCAK